MSFQYDDIPIEVSDKEKKEVAPLTTFTPEVVTKELMRNILLAKFTKPTPVQRYSIPICNMKRDLMACAQTGSGKTAGFLFPCISMMLRAGPPNIPRERSYRSPVYPTALILAPTRELAIQIFKEAKKFCYRTGIQPCVVYGGARSSDQMRELSRGADMLVATPGRLEDFLSKRKISLSCARFLVLDEADQMLDMGFEPQIRDIVERYDMPDKHNRQTMMFSATFPMEIQRLAEDFLVRVSIRNFVRLLLYIWFHSLSPTLSCPYASSVRFSWLCNFAGEPFLPGCGRSGLRCVRRAAVGRVCQRPRQRRVPAPLA